MICVLRSVCQVCNRIPAGKVSTYGEMAKLLNNAPRAVGQVTPNKDERHFARQIDVFSIHDTYKRHLCNAGSQTQSVCSRCSLPPCRHRRPPARRLLWILGAKPPTSFGICKNNG